MTSFVQLSEAVFDEAMYLQYRNNEFRHKRHPLPRGPKWIAQMRQYLDWLNEKALHPIEVVTDYRTRNGNSAS